MDLDAELKLNFNKDDNTDYLIKTSSLKTSNFVPLKFKWNAWFNKIIVFYLVFLVIIF